MSLWENAQSLKFFLTLGFKLHFGFGFDKLTVVFLNLICLFARELAKHTVKQKTGKHCHRSLKLSGLTIKKSP